LRLTSEQLAKFQQYYKLLLQWNQKINLISRKDTHQLISYHFTDSLSVLNEIPASSTVYDLGSGAGLPGIPLKIMRDDINLYLVESTKKKATFLELAKQELQLKNVTVLAERAECLKQISANLGEIQADIVLLRLIGRIKKLAPLAVSLVKPTGKIIFYKSKTAGAEISAAKKVLTKFQLRPTIKEIALPGTKITRRLVILQMPGTAFPQNWTYPKWN